MSTGTIRAAPAVGTAGSLSFCPRNSALLIGDRLNAAEITRPAATAASRRTTTLLFRITFPSLLRPVQPSSPRDTPFGDGTGPRPALRSPRPSGSPSSSPGGSREDRSSPWRPAGRPETVSRRGPGSSPGGPSRRTAAFPPGPGTWGRPPRGILLQGVY